VIRYPRRRERLLPALAGRLVNELLALAVAGHADFLVTGNKNDVLAIGRYAGTPIVTVRDFLSTTGRQP